MRFLPPAPNLPSKHLELLPRADNLAPTINDLNATDGEANVCAVGKRDPYPYHRLRHTVLAAASMSCIAVDDDSTLCANCGKQGSEVVKLKSCTACRLVKYCGVDCQRAHRKQHKKACKERAAVLKDEKLYDQGHDLPEEDFCPICTLPIPLPANEHSDIWVCCMNKVCHGCAIAAQQKGMFDCPFCRTPLKEDNTSILAMVQKRVDAKDPGAIAFLGIKYLLGGLGLREDRPRGMELVIEAAELGSAHALCLLGNLYSFGEEFCGEEFTKDEALGLQYWEDAAMKGHPEARCNLGNHECKNRNYGRAVKHWMISAKLGEKTSLENIKETFVKGVATKEQYTEALKSYLQAVEETKSPERDEAVIFVSRRVGIN